MEFDSDVLTQFAMDYGLKIIAALATLIIGLYPVSIASVLSRDKRRAFGEPVSLLAQRANEQW